MKGDRWLYALALASVASGIAGLFSPLYLVTVGASAVALEISGGAASLAGAPGAIVAGRYADRTGRRRGIVLLVLVVTAVASAVLTAVAAVSVVLAVVGLTRAFIAVTGVAIVSRSSPADVRGGVLGIYAALGAGAELVLVAGRYASRPTPAAATTTGETREDTVRDVTAAARLPRANSNGSGSA